MSSQMFTTRIKTVMNEALDMTPVSEGIMMTGDSNANEIIVELYNNFDRVSIEQFTPIKGYFIRSDGVTLETPGEITPEGYARVVVPDAAYEVSGLLNIAVRMFSEDGGKTVIASLSCLVQETETNKKIN